MINLEEYQNWLQGEGKSENTVLRYIRIAQDFISWYKEHVGQQHADPRFISPQDLQDWKHYLLNDAFYERGGRSQRYSVSTVNNYLKGIRPLFEFLSVMGVVSQDPSAKLKPHRVQTFDGEPRWLDRHERNRLLFFLNAQDLLQKNPWRFHRNRAMIYCGLHAGLRPSEIVDLEVDDLRFDRQYLFVRSGKGGKSRRVEMNADLIDALSSWLDVRGDGSSRKVFLSQRGGGITYKTLEHLCRSLAEKAGLKDFTPHVPRHTFGHDLAVQLSKMPGYAKDQVVMLQVIADLMGHESLNYTRVYLLSSAEERHEAVSRLSGER